MKFQIKGHPPPPPPPPPLPTEVLESTASAPIPSSDSRSDLLDQIKNFKNSKLKNIEEAKKERKKPKPEKVSSGLTVQDEIRKKLEERRKFMGGSKDKSSEPKTQAKANELPSLDRSDKNNGGNVMEKISMMIPEPPKEAIKNESDNDEWNDDDD